MSKEYIVPLSEDEAFYGYKGMTVELIRCKDCKYFIPYCRVVEGKTTYNACALKEDGFSKWRTTENDFCSWAERKTE